MKEKTVKKVGLGIFLAMVAVFALSLYGYISNIMTLAGAEFTVWTGELILRVIGVFLVPLGIIMGFI